MRTLRTALVASVAAMLVLAAPAAAGNPFKGSTTTAGGYHTYDSDQINVEGSSYTGDGVYVAVLDTGLVPNWTDYFPQARIATNLGTGFYQNLTFKVDDPEECTYTETARGPLKQTNFLSARGSTHGTHVTSTIIGYNYDTHFDDLEGYPLPPIQVRGIAPNATIIPVKVLADYTMPASRTCPSSQEVFGTDEMVAAGINYVADLVEDGRLGDHRVVINMSLGGGELVDVEREAIDRAISLGVIIVASAGNEGTDGMGFPGAYEPVISAGAVGWTGEWLIPGETPDADFFRYRVWWLKDVMGTAATADGGLAPEVLPEGTGEVADGAAVLDETYVADFSSRELDGQDLDVLAPGAWVRGPFAGTPGYNHLPWWSQGWGDAFGRNAGNYYYVGGTSMAAPHVTSVAAMMLEANSSLMQADVDAAMTGTALALGAGSRQVWDPFNANGPGFYEIGWDADATGEGLLQADLAIAAVGG